MLWWPCLFLSFLFDMRLNSRSNISLIIYLIALILNAAFLNITYSNNIPVILLFLTSVAVNHFILFYISKKINENDINFAVVSVGVMAKLFILLLGFFVAMSYSDKSVIFLVSAYIFQLIILVLSITRIT